MDDEPYLLVIEGGTDEHDFVLVWYEDAEALDRDTEALAAAIVAGDEEYKSDGGLIDLRSVTG